MSAAPSPALAGFAQGALCAARAESVTPWTIERACALALQCLSAARGPVSGEDITDYCLARMDAPHDQRAFGPVYARLARLGSIERAGFAARRKGHGSPGPVWKLKK